MCRRTPQAWLVSEDTEGEHPISWNRVSGDVSHYVGAGD